MQRLPGPKPSPQSGYAGGGAHCKGLVCTVLLVSMIGANALAAPAPCQARLTIELTPDVPDPREVGFLSSLLSNNVRYQLTLQGQRSDSLIDVELAGPGPAYRCQNVIEGIRKDGRVLSVQVTARS